MPILIFDRFPWGERESVLAALRTICAAGGSEWTFGGAYIFWAQVDAEEGGGTVLYCGEAQDLAQRHAQHLIGPGGGGSKFADLDAYFSLQPGHLCGLALLVIPPRSLPWLFPPDEAPVLEDDAAKRAGEALEGLLLRASKNLFSRMPPFNSRDDASRFEHDDDVVRFQSLVRYLLDYPDVTMDFVTFWIRTESAEAAIHLRREVEDCDGLR